ncbi:hypothetical protein HanIR_Chr10g0475321 [Helianthus annuus]|nr:hypothetical protein HanIR_Chr10g0475321 [Helianthus annuus]
MRLPMAGRVTNTVGSWLIDRNIVIALNTVNYNKVVIAVIESLPILKKQM